MTAGVADKLDSIEHLEFDLVPPCELADKGCPNEAKWIIRMKCCGDSYLLCTKHKDSLIKKVTADLHKASMGFMCSFCEQVFISPPTVSSMITITPIE